jgi:hypothetical protein
MEIKLERITIQNIIDGYVVDRDNYHLYNDAFLHLRKDIFLNNPNLDDANSTCAFLVRADGIVVGHLFPFPTRIKAGDSVIRAASASDLFVLKEFEKYAAGADLVMAPIRDKMNAAVVLADISAEGMDCYHAFRFKDFALPKMMQPHSTKFIYQNLGLKGLPLNLASFISDLFLKPFISFSMWRLRKATEQYEVKKLENVPEWVDSMVINDGHKYMEIHDHKWMQWCLDNSYSDNTTYNKYFCAIYKEDTPIGFFINYERIMSIPARNIYNMRQGTLMEWGSYDESKLSELEITKIAMAHFSDNLALCQFATTNMMVIKKMRQYGFFHHNYHHVVFKDNTKTLKDCGDANLWRLRFGYADSLF